MRRSKRNQLSAYIHPDLVQGVHMPVPLCFTSCSDMHQLLAHTHPDLHLRHHCQPAFQLASGLASSAGAPCETPSAYPSCLSAHLLLELVVPDHHLYSKCTQASWNHLDHFVQSELHELQHHAAGICYTFSHTCPWNMSSSYVNMQQPLVQSTSGHGS